ncbi:MAG: O-antigen ligase family protein [Bifidobacteriaceae bacterium]|nr:O-antigen ligase family protein [Bifidobacteriaceae bacterium]
MALGLPFVLSIERGLTRVLCLPCVLLTLILSASRTAIIGVAAGAVLGLAVYGCRLSRRVRSAAVTLLFLISATVPFLGFSDDFAARRGLIWRASVATYVSTHPLFGLGTEVYQSNTGLQARAQYSGITSSHNWFLTEILVSGPIVAVGAVLAVSITLGYAIRLDRYAPVFAAYATTFAVSASAESISIVRDVSWTGGIVLPLVFILASTIHRGTTSQQALEADITGPALGLGHARNWGSRRVAVDQAASPAHLSHLRSRERTRDRRITATRP